MYICIIHSLFVSYNGENMILGHRFDNRNYQFGVIPERDSWVHGGNGAGVLDDWNSVDHTSGLPVQRRVMEISTDYVCLYLGVVSYALVVCV